MRAARAAITSTESSSSSPHSAAPADTGADTAFAPLSERAAAALREAVSRAAAPDSLAGDPAVAAAIAAIAAEARARGLRPEQLLPRFKALLDSLPELHAEHARPEDVRQRERLVTRCIKAYFGA